MRVVFNSDLKANLSIDDAQRIRQINHFQEYWASEKKTPILAAIDYFHQVAELLQIPKEQFRNMHQQVSFLEPMERGIEYRKSEEKTFFDSTTLGFYQTYLNVPVWQSGLTTTIKHSPYRIVSAVNTSQEGFNAKLPPSELIDRYRELFDRAKIEQAKVGQASSTQLGESEETSETADFIRNLVDNSRLQGVSNTTGDNQTGQGNNARLIRGRFYVYKYDESQRLPQVEREQENHSVPVLPLPPLDDNIQNGQYYVVAEITFSFSTQEFGDLNWLALVELETGSILYLRALADALNGLVFKQDPITKTGNAANTANQSNAMLNPLQDLVILPNLDAPVGGVQSLRGTYANVINVENPNIAPPTNPAGTDFNYDVRTNEFAAVNAYYHVDRFFALVESLGFSIATYFNNTTFPLPTDHRDHMNTATGIEINAHCIGNGMGGIGHVGYALDDLTDTVNPVGIAADWRVHLHELGGHGVLYEHVNSANFGFSHSAGDSVAVILNDPESLAPDRFLLAPWVPITRRFDRDVASGWAWGGSHDIGGYSSEQILATTLFRVYRSIGGDSTDLGRRQFASRMMIYLILRAISTLTPATNPSNALAFANALMAVDLLNWTTEGVYGGAYNKVMRWSFEKQGLYQAPGAPTPVTTAGQPPAVDVYIDDGRSGEYPYLAVHWATTTIWNRRNPDGLTSHEEPALGASNYAYVKIKNRGTQTANNVKVKGFHCKPSAGLLWPTDLQPFTTAEITVGTLAGNNTEEKIVGPFEWTPIINAYGHDCMLMIASADDDASNIDNFTLSEVIPEWRLVPNDNNIGQRNVILAPGGGGLEGLLKGLDKYSFWVGNPNLKTSLMELRVQLPGFLTASGWRLSFKGISNNQFELRSGKQQEVVMSLQPGKDFVKSQVEKATDKDILISVYADGMLVGGMTYRLDPEIKEPYNQLGKVPGSDKSKCLDKAQKLLECLDISGQDVKSVQMKKVTLDIELHNNDCHCS